MAKNALQAQLLKAGLVDDKKAKKLTKQAAHAKRIVDDPDKATKESVAKAQAEKLEKDQKLNFERQKALINKTFSVLLILLISSTALAESAADTSFKNVGVIDENYAYTSPDFVREVFRSTSNDYAKLLPLQMNELIEVYLVSFLPQINLFEYRFTVPMNEDHKQDIIDEMSSPQSIKVACEDYFLVNKYMVVNDVTLIYSYNDIEFRPMYKLIMNNEVCLEQLDQE